MDPRKKCEVRLYWFRTVAHNYALINSIGGLEKEKITDITEANLVLLKATYDFLKEVRATDKAERNDLILEKTPEMYVEIGLDDKSFYSYCLNQLMFEYGEYGMVNNDELLDEHILVLRSVLIDIVGCGYLNEKETVRNDVIDAITDMIQEPHDLYD